MDFYKAMVEGISNLNNKQRKQITAVYFMAILKELFPEDDNWSMGKE